MIFQKCRKTLSPTNKEGEKRKKDDPERLKKDFLRAKSAALEC